MNKPTLHNWALRPKLCLPSFVEQHKMANVFGILLNGQIHSRGQMALKRSKLHFLTLALCSSGNLYSVYEIERDWSNVSTNKWEITNFVIKYRHVTGLLGLSNHDGFFWGKRCFLMTYGGKGNILNRSSKTKK